VDPEFKRILLRVVLLGGIILVIGAGTLVIAFRSYATKDGKNREFRATVLIAALLAFVLLVCLMLMRMSMLR
jgi:hypothetical protein